MRPRFHITFFVLLMFMLCTGSDVKSSTRSLIPPVRDYIRAHQKEILQELVAFLSLPNHAGDRENIFKNAVFIREALEKRGVRARLLEVPDANPVVYGEKTVPDAKYTVIFYAHYDGQPVRKEHWSSDPYTPVFRDGPPTAMGPILRFPEDFDRFTGETRLYARSASDDKSPIIALLTALDALEASGRQPAINMKFFFEGEEEVGSPNISRYLDKFRDLLEGDIWVLCDGPVHQTRRQAVYLGARGVIGLELTIYGPLRPLHSGHYGNWAPNPGIMLAHLIARLRDEKGRILIPGFYDDVLPLGEAEKKALQELPVIDDALKSELALARTESEPETLYEALNRPALNLRGIEVGAVGEKARNVIPTEARASFDIRLVLGQKPERVKQLFTDYLKSLGYTIIDHEPTPEERRKHPRLVRLEWESGYPAFRSRLDHPAVKAVIHAVKQVKPDTMIFPTIGGSVPAYLFVEKLHTPVIIVPMVNHDNNQHGPDENLRLQNLWDGIIVYSAIMIQAGSGKDN